MKRLLYNSYGNTSTLTWESLEIPTLKADEILVKVLAVSINPVDIKIKNGDMKIMTGSKFPRGIGCDFSGIISKVGSDVSNLSINDEVFGWIPYKDSCSLGDYVVINSNLAVKKPSNISFSEAACLPMAGGTALFSLTEKCKLSSGTEILINGCTGGVGIFAVQLAKYFGANVTGTCSSANIEFAENLGVNLAVEYTKDSVFRLEKKFDVIFDIAGSLKFEEASNLLVNTGKILNINGSPIELLHSKFRNAFSSKKEEVFYMTVTKDLMLQLSKLSSDGVIKPYIGLESPIDDAINIINHFTKGTKVLGKTVLIQK
jgi:NADPH:quinone reductase-like Zn-dependent oxidoreductase